MPESDKPPLTDDAYLLLAQKDIILLALRRHLKRALIRWGVRTAIGGLLFGWLAWKYPWGRWLLYTWLPLCLFSLGLIIYGFVAISRKSAKIETIVESTRGDGEPDGISS